MKQDLTLVKHITPYIKTTLTDKFEGFVTKAFGC